MITETDPIARALDAAAARWPADRGARHRLLLHLIEEGHRALLAEQDSSVEARRIAVASTSGILTGVYGENYLADLRSEWPE